MLLTLVDNSDEGGNGRDTRRNMLRALYEHPQGKYTVERLVSLSVALPTIRAFQARRPPMRFRQRADLRSGAQCMRARLQRLR